MSAIMHNPEQDTTLCLLATKFQKILDNSANTKLSKLFHSFLIHLSSFTQPFKNFIYPWVNHLPGQEALVPLKERLNVQV